MPGWYDLAETVRIDHFHDVNRRAVAWFGFGDEYDKGLADAGDAVALVSPVSDFYHVKRQ